MERLLFVINYGIMDIQEGHLIKLNGLLVHHHAFTIQLARKVMWVSVVDHKQIELQSIFYFELTSLS